MNDPKPIVCLLAAALLCAAADLQPKPFLDALETLPRWRVSIETAVGEDTIVSLYLGAGRLAPGVAMEVLASQLIFQEK